MKYPEEHEFISYTGSYKNGWPKKGKLIYNEFPGNWFYRNFSRGEKRERYDGLFNKGVPSKGYTTYRNGNKYSHSKRVMAYNADDNRLKFVVPYLNGEPSPKAIKTYADGRTFIGEFQNNAPSKGRMTYPNTSYCSQYDGEIVNGKRHGYGFMTYADGRTFMGHFQNNAPSNGCMTYKDKSDYEGEILNDKRHGHGAMTYSDGSPGFQAHGAYVSGEWVDGRFEGNGRRLEELSRNPLIARRILREEARMYAAACTCNCRLPGCSSRP